MQELPENPSNSTIACIFDLDGVLVNTAGFHFLAWKRLANTLGFDFTAAQNEHLKGVSRIRSLEMILEWAGVRKSPEEKEALAATKNTWYLARVNQMTPADVLPGTTRLLTALQKEGIKIAIGSASKNTGVILNKTQLSHFFNVIVDGNIVSASKPDPEVFTTAAKLLGVAPQQCVVFEDAQAGIEAALAGGIKVIAVGKEEELKGASHYIDDLSQITVPEIRTLINAKAQ